MADEVIYYPEEWSFRRAIYQNICDPDGVKYLPAASKSMSSEVFTQCLIADREAMIRERCLTASGNKILDKGYKECISMHINIPMEAMA